MGRKLNDWSAKHADGGHTHDPGGCSINGGSIRSRYGSRESASGLTARVNCSFTEVGSWKGLTETGSDRPRLFRFENRTPGRSGVTLKALIDVHAATLGSGVNGTSASAGSRTYIRCHRASPTIDQRRPPPAFSASRTVDGSNLKPSPSRVTK